MALTFTELQDEVRFSLGGRTDLDSRLGRAINMAQQRLAKIHDFDEFEINSTSTISNTGNTSDKYITLPLKREIYSLVVMDGTKSHKLVQRTAQWWDRLITTPEYFSRDMPHSYTVWNNTIEMFPMPDADYTLRLRWTKWPADLSSGSSTSEFLRKDEILIELALVYIFRTLGKEQDAITHWRMAELLIAEAKITDDNKPDLNIVPGPSDIEVAGMNTNEYWNDPFYKG